MRKGLFVFYFIFVFIVGWFAHAIYINNFIDVSNAFPSNSYKTLEQDTLSELPMQTKTTLIKSEDTSDSILVKFFAGDNERNSPKDRISENQIHVFKDKIVIDINNPSWSSFVNTNSMDPVFDYGVNGIEVTPSSPLDIQVGDVISYEYKDKNTNNIRSIIAHRVVEIGKDEQGIYYIAKGDNNVIKDPEKVRFEQVKGVLVGLIY